MGLDVSHDCWEGPYSQFGRWRRWVAGLAKIPLELMEGFCQYTLDPRDVDRLKDIGWDNDAVAIRAIVDGAVGATPIPWSILKPDPLYKLLHHSDCDGELAWEDCLDIADALAVLIDGVPSDKDDTKPARGCYDGMVPATERWIEGLRAAYEAKENVRFY